MNQTNHNITAFFGNFSTETGKNWSSQVPQLCHTFQNTVSMDFKGPLVSTVLLVATNSLAAIFTVTINFIIIIVILRKENLRTSANMVLTSMAVSDFLVGLVVQPLLVLNMILLLMKSRSCAVKQISNYSGALCVGASLFNISFFAADRFIATVNPYRYLEDVIYNKYRTIILFAWFSLTLVSGLTCASVLDARVFYGLTTALYGCCILIILGSYGVIYRVVRAQRRKIAMPQPKRIPKESKENPMDAKRSCGALPLSNINELKNSSCVDDGSHIEIIEAAISTERRENIAELKHESRNYTVFLIVAVFFFCYTPISVIKAIHREDGMSDSTFHVSLAWANTLVLLNSALNPIIYCWRVSSLRKEVKIVLNRLFHRISGK